MSDRSLRGMRLGSQSMETESNVQPAPRQRVEYRTADGDRVFVTFAAEAEIPSVWTAKSGKEADLVNRRRRRREARTYPLGYAHGTPQHRRAGKDSGRPPGILPQALRALKAP